MTEQNVLASEPSHGASFTLRDLLAVVFRHTKLMLLSFLGIIAATLFHASQQPVVYQTQMKILVKRERADPLVTPEANSSPNVGFGVTEQELNSEIELLKSRDLLEKVAVVSKLQEVPAKVSLWSRWLVASADQAQRQTLELPGVVQNLHDQLQAQPLERSNLISVTYQSFDPQLAARVLNNLAGLYLEKHLAVHRPPGTLEFFQQETERYRKGLAAIEARLTNFNQNDGVVSPLLEKEITVGKVTEFEARLRDTQAAVAETKERVRALEAQGSSTSSFLTTAVVTSSNAAVIQQLKATLFNLELKRTDLLGKYEPTYRTVQELERQISQTRTALAAEENLSLRDETSSRNPVYEMVEQELAKANLELPALRARAATLAQTVRVYREKARELEEKEMLQHDLVREHKVAEENYQLYLRKQEEARISNALDQKRIINVAVVEEATVPSGPASSGKPMIVLVGGLLASLVSVGLALVSDYYDPSFRTPDELQSFLGIPVLAAVPKNDV